MEKLDYYFIENKSFLFIFKRNPEKRKQAKNILEHLFPIWSDEFIKQKLKDSYSFSIDKKGRCSFYKDLYYTNWWGRDSRYLIEIEDNSFIQKPINKMKPLKPFPYWFIF